MTTTNTIANPTVAPVSSERAKRAALAKIKAAGEQPASPEAKPAQATTLRIAGFELDVATVQRILGDANSRLGRYRSETPTVERVSGTIKTGVTDWEGRALALPKAGQPYHEQAKRDLTLRKASIAFLEALAAYGKAE